MGRLRFCCALLIIVSIAYALQLQARGILVASILLAIGTLILAVITPIPAGFRARRIRVLQACCAYVAASAPASAVAILLNPNSFTLSTLVLPLAGSLLAWWAYRSRNWRRVLGFEGYYHD